MAENEEKKNEPQNEKKRWWQRFSFKKLNNKYVFMMSHDETMEPIVDFKVNLLKISIITVCVVIFFMIVTAIVIFFTPLKEYIPGFAGRSSMEREVYALYRRADSIEREMARKDIYFNNLKLVIEGYDFENDSTELLDIYAPLPGINTDTIELKKSIQDSILRAEFEQENLFSLSMRSNLIAPKRYYGVANFFTPIAGTIVNNHDPSEGHYGVDIAATDNQLIKATLDGTIVFASWTVDYGYTIGIQHQNNYFSTYKHNATLLKKEGDYVKAGEAIAVLGESGDQISEPLLHFELWHNGISLNPVEYINFEKQTN